MGVCWFAAVGKLVSGLGATMRTAVLTLVTLVQAFAGLLVCCGGQACVWLGSYSENSSTRTRHTCTGVCHCGKYSNARTRHNLHGRSPLWEVSIPMFDLRKAGQVTKYNFDN